MTGQEPDCGEYIHVCPECLTVRLYKPAELFGVEWLPRCCMRTVLYRREDSDYPQVVPWGRAREKPYRQEREDVIPYYAPVPGKEPTPFWRQFEELGV
jgi:hypothetical protein